MRYKNNAFIIQGLSFSNILSSIFLNYILLFALDNTDSAKFEDAS